MFKTLKQIFAKIVPKVIVSTKNQGLLDHFLDLFLGELGPLVHFLPLQQKLLGLDILIIFLRLLLDRLLQLVHHALD